MHPNPDWQTARDETLERWLKIRGMVSEPDELELLTEINAIGELCEVAQSAAPQVFGRCERCVVYQQFGGCDGINGEMSERIVEHDWDRLLVLVDRFINNLRELEIAPGSDPESGHAS